MAQTKLTSLPITTGGVTSVEFVQDITYHNPEIVTICGENGQQLEFIRVDAVDDIPYNEELILRRDNEFVKGLYEEYRVALILAAKG